MPLRPPKRLPRRFRRSATPQTRSLVRTYYGGSVRRRRRRQEKFIRFSRRAGRLFTVVASEFKLWLAIGIGATILAVTAILLFAPFFDVREIHVCRQDPRIDPEEVEEALSPLFNQRLVLVTRGQVQSMLEPLYPDLQKAEIDKDYPSSLTVTIFLEPVVATLEVKTGEEAAPTETGASASGAFLPPPVTPVTPVTPATRHAYITKSGYFVESPIPIKTLVSQRLVITDIEEYPKMRSRLLTPQFLDSLFLASDILRRDFGLPSEQITIFVRAQEFHIRTPKTTLWFDLSSPLPLQFSRFREFLKTASIDQAKEYIDLRIADKIIYK